MAHKRATLWPSRLALLAAALLLGLLLLLHSTDSLETRISTRLTRLSLQAAQDPEDPPAASGDTDKKKKESSGGEGDQGKAKKGDDFTFEKSKVGESTLKEKKFTGSVLKEQDHKELVKKVNELRKKVSDGVLNAVKWSKELADKASNWASYIQVVQDCDLTFRVSSKDPVTGQERVNGAEYGFKKIDVGEALYSLPAKEKPTSEQVVDWWAKVQSKCDPKEQTASQLANSHHGCTNFVALLQDKSEEIGCGTSHCLGVENNQYVVVCFLSPPGNGPNKLPFEVKHKREQQEVKNGEVETTKSDKNNAHGT